MSLASHFNPPDNLNIIRPLEGYSPQPGTFVSMLNWMRDSVIRAVIFFLAIFNPGETKILRLYMVEV
jgi:hypothetical protein